MYVFTAYIGLTQGEVPGVEIRDIGQGAGHLKEIDNATLNTVHAFSKVWSLVYLISG